jgi:hypothetical protein
VIAGAGNMVNFISLPARRSTSPLQGLLGRSPVRAAEHEPPLADDVLGDGVPRFGGGRSFFLKRQVRRAHLPQHVCASAAALID